MRLVGWNDYMLPKLLYPSWQAANFMYLSAQSLTMFYEIQTKFPFLTLFLKNIYIYGLFDLSVGSLIANFPYNPYIQFIIYIPTWIFS